MLTSDELDDPPKLRQRGCGRDAPPARHRPADRHVELFLGMLEPDQMHEAHVNLIQHGRKLCHARRPECSICPIRPRCRYVDPKAP